MIPVLSPLNQIQALLYSQIHPTSRILFPGLSQSTPTSRILFPDLSQIYPSPFPPPGAFPRFIPVHSHLPKAPPRWTRRTISHQKTTWERGRNVWNSHLLPPLELAEHPLEAFVHVIELPGKTGIRDLFQGNPGDPGEEGDPGGNQELQGGIGNSREEPEAPGRNWELQRNFRKEPEAPGRNQELQGGSRSSWFLFGMSGSSSSREDPGAPGKSQRLQEGTRNSREDPGAPGSC